MSFYLPCKHWPVHFWDLLDLQATWPMASLAPHRVWGLTVARRKTELIGWPPSGQLWFPRDGTLNGPAKGRWVFFWVSRRNGLWDKSLPFSEIMQHLNKTSFLSHQPLPPEFAYWWQLATKPQLLFGNTTSAKTCSYLEKVGLKPGWGASWLKQHPDTPRL